MRAGYVFAVWTPALPISSCPLVSGATVDFGMDFHVLEHNAPVLGFLAHSCVAVADLADFTFHVFGNPQMSTENRFGGSCIGTHSLLLRSRLVRCGITRCSCSLCRLC